MSDNETTKITDDEGNTWYEAIDGKRYKTRSGAWKRTQKLRLQGDVTETPLNTPNETESETEFETESKTEDEPDFDTPEWAQFDMGDLPEGVQVIPSALKKVRRPVGKPSKKKSKAELKQEKLTNQSILKVGYRTGDYLMTKYARAVCVDDEMLITHTEADYEWISGITYDFLDDRGVNLAIIIGPGMMAAAANSYWFGKPLMEIRKKAEKSLLGSAGKKLGGLKKWFRIPFFGRKKKTQDSSFGPDWDASTGLEP